MRLDLSSYITLERIPARYYRPENDFEEYTQTRYEKIPTSIYESPRRASKKVANQIVKLMREKEATGKPFVLGVSGSVSPLLIYEELVSQHKEDGVSFKNLVAFNIYEYYPVYDSSFSNLQL